jgi:hypothetical protein
MSEKHIEITGRYLYHNGKIYKNTSTSFATEQELLRSLASALDRRNSLNECIENARILLGLPDPKDFDE